MKNALIVGVGGVGSFLASSIANYILIEQLPELLVTLADGDVVDNKNLLYQNFSADSLFENKAKALHLKYPFFSYIPENIDVEKYKQNLFAYDIVISAVDGTKFRRELFNYVFNENKNIYWIDIRAVSGSVAIYCKHRNNTYNKMLETLPKIDQENKSCQLPIELENNTIQNGNRIAAEIGMQYLLNWYRNKEHFNSSTFIHQF